MSVGAILNGYAPFRALYDTCISVRLLVLLLAGVSWR